MWFPANLSGRKPVAVAAPPFARAAPNFREENHSIFFTPIVSRLLRSFYLKRIINAFDAAGDISRPKRRK
jgi:hypothetical protein